MDYYRIWFRVSLFSIISLVIIHLNISLVNRFLAFFQHFPWIVPLFRKFGIAEKQLTRFRDFARERVRMRKLNGSVSKDLFYHLVNILKLQHLGTSIHGYP